MSQHRYTLVRVIIITGIMSMFAMYTGPGVPLAYAIPCGTNCLNITNTPTASLTLNGQDQTAPYTLTFSLDNQSTTGWHVTITSTQFFNASHGHTLALSASSVTAVTAVCQPLQTCSTMPTNDVTYPVAVPAGPVGDPLPAAVKFYNAAADSGEGTFDISTTIAIAVPANAYAGSYSSTLTLAYASGP